MVHDRLILSIGLRHMGYVLRREIRDALRAMPDDLLSPAETLVIFEIADDANDATRRTTRGSDDLAWLLRMTPAAFRKHVQRIEAKGIKLRIEVGLDSIGRTTYAHKGIQTNYLIPRLSTGTPMAGQSVHPKSQRVDRLSSHTEPMGGQSVQQRVDNLSTPSPQIPSIKTSSSGASYRDRIAALTGTDDDGIDLVIDKIKSSTKKPVRNLGALIRSISDQDIVDHHASLAPASLLVVAPSQARRCPVHPGTTSWPCSACLGDLKAGEDPFHGREDLRPDGWLEAHPLAARLLERSLVEAVEPEDVWVSPVFDGESGDWVTEGDAGGDSLESTSCTNPMCHGGYISLGASGRRPCRVCGGPVAAGKPASVADVLGSFADSFGGM
jgi:hypothetical protein